MTKISGTTFNVSDFLKQGHLWVAPIWNHTERRTSPRPIVIVGNEKSNDKIGLIVNFVTKQGARDEFDVPIHHWAMAGLACESWVRTSKPLTILKTDLRQQPVERNGILKPQGYIGELHRDDLEVVIRMCKNIF